MTLARSNATMKYDTLRKIAVFVVEITKTNTLKYFFVFFKNLKSSVYHKSTKQSKLTALKKY